MRRQDRVASALGYGALALAAVGVVVLAATGGSPPLTPVPLPRDSPVAESSVPDTDAPNVTGGPADESEAAYYESCAEARRAGAAPLVRGGPGYRPELDRDGDGRACES